MRAYLKAGIFSVALLAAGVLVSPSAQFQIQRATTWFWSSSAAAMISANGNDFTVTLADWGTALSPEAVSVANAGTLFLGTSPGGYLFVYDMVGEIPCAFRLRGPSNATTEWDDTNAVCSATKDNASTVNVYYDASGASGAGYYLQNNRAGTRTFRITLSGV